MTDKIRLGISSCLLGYPVRYDGGHKLDRFLTGTLGRFVDFIPVCPEVEAGLGVPRESMRLEGDPRQPRLMTTRTRVDLADRMLAWAGARVEELAREELDGFIFKSGSPSCGLERVPIHHEGGAPAGTGIGLFARAFRERFPLRPARDERRLRDPGRRENFIEALCTLRRWRESLAAGRSRGRLADFHTRHKLLVMSHSVEHYRRMGKLVAAAAGETALPTLYARYETMLLEALRLAATVRKQTNVLQHMAGYFKEVLPPEEKRELAGVIERYRIGLVPLSVPLVLIDRQVRKYRQPYLAGQVYLYPHPLELRLRKHSC